MLTIVRRLIHRIITRLLTRRCTVREFPTVIVNTRPDIDTNAVIVRLGEALDLFRTYMPHRYRHAAHDISGFLIDRRPVYGLFIPPTRQCVLELTALANPEIPVARIAALILHESMHARLHARGFVFSRAVAARHERFCRRAEVKFGLLVPGGEWITTNAQSWLDKPDETIAPDIDWAESHRQERVKDLQNSGLPAWMQRRVLRHWRRTEHPRDGAS